MYRQSWNYSSRARKRFISTLAPSTFIGTATEQSSASAALATAIKLAGSAVESAFASASLNSSIAGAVNAIATAAAVLTTAVQLVGGKQETVWIQGKDSQGYRTTTSFKVSRSASPAVATATGALASSFALSDIKVQTVWIQAKDPSTGVRVTVPLTVTRNLAHAIATAAGDLKVGAGLRGTATEQSSAQAALVNWATQTMVAPLYTGPGGLFDPGLFVGTPPQAGDVVFYDPTYITILSNGEVVSTNNNCSAIVQYLDSSGVMQTGTIVIVPTMVGYAIENSIASGGLSTAIKLAAAASVAASTAASITTDFKLQAAASILASASAALSTAVRMSGAAVANAVSSGQLPGGAAALVGNISAVVTATGALNTGVALKGDAIQNTSATGNLSSGIKLAGTALATASASGTLPQISQLAGAAQSLATLIGILSTGIPLAGSANEVAFATGQLATAINLLSGVVVNTNASASLSKIPAALSGIATEISDAAAALSTAVKLAGDALQESDAEGQFHAESIDIAGDAAVEVISRGSITHGDGTSLPDVDPTSIVLIIDPRRSAYRQLFTKVIYLGFDSPAQIVVTQSMKPLPLSAVTRMQLMLARHDEVYIVDTNMTDSAIDWYTIGSGVVLFRLSELQIPPGIYDATLIAFDPAHAHGQIIAHPNAAKLRFQFVQPVSA